MLRLCGPSLLLCSLPLLVALQWDSFPRTNAAYNLKTGPNSAGPAAATPFYKPLGPTLSLDACAAAAAAWRNATAPSDRCLTAVWLRAPANASFARTCWCMPQPKWIPVEDDGADSARIQWPCESDFDCSFNGACGGGGACECDAGWRGPRCGELALGPVDRAAPGLREVSAAGHNVSTWGAPMLQDEATKVWHAWASEMVDGCGLNSWRTNSQVVHATARAGPGGPWARQGVVWPVFAHEPNVVRGPSGEWVVVWSAFPLPNATDRCTNCSEGTTSPLYPRGGCGPHAMHEFKQMMGVAPGPSGPWETLEIPQLSTAWDWNLAIAIFPNKSAIGMIRGGMVWRAEQYSNASSWEPVGGTPEGPSLPDNGNVEDPFVWIDKRGRLHAVLHNMEPSTGQVAYCGVHAFSEDGLAWTSGGWAFGATVAFSDGTNFTFTRRERPHLVFKEDGVTPLALSNGAQFGGVYGDGVFTLVQPILTA